MGIFPTWVVRARMKLLYWLYEKNSYRASLKARFPEHVDLFEKLDRDGIIILRNFISPEQYGEAYELMRGRLNAAEAKESSGSLYRLGSFSVSECSSSVQSHLEEKFALVYALLCYVDGYEIAQSRFGPTLQGTKEISGVIGDNCEPHVDCFQPSGKAFLYLTDVTEEDSPFTYVVGTNQRNDWRIGLEC